MKRTLILGIFTVIITFLFSASTIVNSFASQSADQASMLPWLSLTILSGSTPVTGSSVTITGPSGTTYHTTDANGQVCTSRNYEYIRVTWNGPSRDFYGCKDINHNYQTMCATNPHILYNGSTCNE